MVCMRFLEALVLGSVAIVCAKAVVLLFSLLLHWCYSRVIMARGHNVKSA